jgi:hypothetical protein
LNGRSGSKIHSSYKTKRASQSKGMRGQIKFQSHSFQALHDSPHVQPFLWVLVPTTNHESPHVVCEGNLRVAWLFGPFATQHRQQDFGVAVQREKGFLSSQYLENEKKELAKVSDQ